MKNPSWPFRWGLALLLGSVTWLSAAQDAPGPALPLEPVTAIFDAFRSHQMVALGGAHGNEQGDDRAANGIIMTIFATGVGGAVVLLASHSRPFTGKISVHPAVLLQVMPEASPSGPSATP